MNRNVFPCAAGCSARNTTRGSARDNVYQLRLIVGLLLLAGCLAVMTGALAQTQWRLASAYSDSTFHTQNLRRFAEEFGRSGIEAPIIAVHANGSLVKPAEIHAALREGRVEMGEVILSGLAARDPLWGVDAIPFLVTGYDDAKVLWEISRAQLEKRAAADGLVLLYAVPWPPQHLYSSRAIASIKDFKGLTMRTYNPATSRLAELTGAKPTLIQVVDLARAISAGEVDLMLTSSWTGVEAQAWSRMKHFYTVSGWMPKNGVFVNRAAFEKLTPAARARMQALARDAENRGWAESQTNARRYEAELVTAGMQVAAPSAYLHDDLRRLGERFARDWLKTGGADGLSVLLSFEARRFAQALPKE